MKFIQSTWWVTFRSPEIIKTLCIFLISKTAVFLPTEGFLAWRDVTTSSSSSSSPAESSPGNRLDGHLSLPATHCGSVMPYVNGDLGQHWLRWWLVARKHQAITWTDADLLFIRPSCRNKLQWNLHINTKLFLQENVLNSSPLVSHISSVNWIIIGSSNGWLPVRCQAITWTNAGFLSIGLLGRNFGEIWIRILSFLFKKIHLKMLSAKMAAILSKGDEL